MAEPLAQNLRDSQRWIRDYLGPLLAGDGKFSLDRYHVDQLREILLGLNDINISLDLLRFSRIEKALMLITAAGGWPIDAVEMAVELLEKWEQNLGSLKGIRADLWGPGGRLDGLIQSEFPRTDDDVFDPSEWKSRIVSTISTTGMKADTPFQAAQILLECLSRVRPFPPVCTRRPRLHCWGVRLPYSCFPNLHSSLLPS